jgi:hypothetical protein
MMEILSEMCRDARMGEIVLVLLFLRVLWALADRIRLRRQIRQRMAMRRHMTSYYGPGR